MENHHQLSLRVLRYQGGGQEDSVLIQQKGACDIHDYIRQGSVFRISRNLDDKFLNRHHQFT